MHVEGAADLFAVEGNDRDRIEPVEDESCTLPSSGTASKLQR
jgi:hypothetical protein